MTKDELDAFLGEERMCRLGSVDGDGAPHVSPLWFVWDGSALWLHSIVKSQRWVNLMRDPSSERRRRRRLRLRRVRAASKCSVGSRWSAMYHGPTSPTPTPPSRNGCGPTSTQVARSTPTASTPGCDSTRARSSAGTSASSPPFLRGERSRATRSRCPQRLRLPHVTGGGKLSREQSTRSPARGGCNARSARRDATSIAPTSTPCGTPGCWRCRSRPRSAACGADTAVSARRLVRAPTGALAGGDASVALVSSMHPAVIAFWLASPDPSQPEWERQRRAVFASALAGEQWGTITSEPGSGGDIFRTRATAAPLDGEPFLPGRAYAVTGDKHFGSGMGVTDRMMTTAVAEGDDAPAIFVLDVRGRPWDGSAGLRLIAEWDGMGMTATQSHAMRLDGVPSVRMAWGGKLEAITRAAGPLVATLFTSVVLGVLDEAVGLARDQMPESRRPVAAVRAGRVGTGGAGPLAGRAGLRGLAAGDRVGRPRRRLPRRPARQGVGRRARRADPAATHAGAREAARSRSAHRSRTGSRTCAPSDFLRPPWGLAYDQLFATSIE